MNCAPRCVRHHDSSTSLAVNAAAAQAVAQVREGRHSLLECRTYRFRSDSMFDAELYRTKEEVAEWKARDPITRFFDLMQAARTLGTADLEAFEAEVAKEIDEAVAFTEAGTLEPVSALTRFVYSEGASAPCSSMPSIDIFKLRKPYD